MKLLIIVSTVLIALTGCTNTPKAKPPTYLELMANSKFKVGKTVKLDGGFYAGCEVTITQIKQRWGALELQYIGTSPCVPGELIEVQ